MVNHMNEKFENIIRDVRNFPQEGVLFKDIFPLLASSFDEVLEAMVGKIEDRSKIDYVTGLESRGFILAAGIAAKLKKGFVPIRKQGKLPPPTVTQKVSLEYGEAYLEMPLGKGNLLLVDDVVATGGSLKGALELTSRAGFQVLETIALINLKHINIHPLSVKAVMEYEK